MSRRLTKAQAAIVAELRDLKVTPARIARRLQRPIADIRAHLGMPPKKWATLTHEDENEIRRQFELGVGTDAICSRFRIGRRRAAEIRQGLSPASRALAARAARSKPRIPEPDLVEVPAWVPERLTDLYLNVAERDGEEAAASTCRALKNGSSVRTAPSNAGSRLPAVVSPAGCA